MKTKNLSRKAIEHLIFDLKYESNKTVEALIDAPFLFISNKEVDAVYSVNEYNKSSLKEVNEHKVLSILTETKTPKELTRTQKLIIQLVKKLNSNKYKDLSNYEVAFNYDFDTSSYPDKPRIYPVTNHARGGISNETMQFILDFSKENNLTPYFTYCNVHNEEERYGTKTPCVTFY